MRALIDGDSLVYTIGFACQRSIHQAVEVFEDDLTGEKEHIVHFETDKRNLVYAFIEENGSNHLPLQYDSRIVVSPAEHAFHSLKIVIQKICQRARANSYKIYLTGEGNFREGLATIMGYKHNRLGKPKPALYQEIRDYLVKHHKAQIVRGIEADDALSIAYQTSLSKEPVNVSKDPSHPVWRYPDDAIICAIDKDLRTVPGHHINFGKHVIDKDGEYQFLTVTEEQARHNFWMQTLTGDSSDNIVGVPRFGEKRAEQALQGCHSEQDYFDTVYQIYLRYYGTEWFDYWHWSAYKDSTASYSKRELKPQEELDEIKFSCRLRGSALTMLLENARLLWMLRKPPQADGSHWWMPPRSWEEIEQLTQKWIEDGTIASTALSHIDAKKEGRNAPGGRPGKNKKHLEDIEGQKKLEEQGFRPCPKCSDEQWVIYYMEEKGCKDEECPVRPEPEPLAEGDENQSDVQAESDDTPPWEGPNEFDTEIIKEPAEQEETPEEKPEKPRRTRKKPDPEPSPTLQKSKEERQAELDALGPWWNKSFEEDVY